LLDPAGAPAAEVAACYAQRWEVARYSASSGDDEASRQLLGDMDLVDHSVGELGRILLVPGR
jgi:hypothetical protein